MNLKSAEVQTWEKNRIKRNQIVKYMDGDKDFIDESKIVSALESNKSPERLQIKDILQKSLAIETLTADETAALIGVSDPDIVEEMEAAAAEVKRRVYDNRIVTFAPLYLANFCVNDCFYCGFRKTNKEAQRRILSKGEVQNEIKVLAGEIGHKRLIVVYGEHPKTDLDYMVSTIKTIYDVKVKTKNGWGQIRRANINAAPLSIEALKELHDVGIGTYQVFQETYHHDTYKRVHPQGTIKGDYLWRLYCMHRSMEAGADDVGIGALFGLYDWKFEIMGLLLHARELERKFNIGPHTISFPRLEPAAGAPLTQDSKYKVSDSDFRRLVTVIRLAVPYTGMIITARESAQSRREIIPLGCTQTDASTRIGIGAYSDRYNHQEQERQQFILGDIRSLDELICELAQKGNITSFCTAGYRCGRTGKCIMDLLRSGQEGKFCKLNAILTFREWLDDFASQETKIAGEEIIVQEIEQVRKTMPKIFPQMIQYYQRIKNGERDLYF